mmetsp:Transcript_11391/g.28805  ORF Transcript_11391/g.28805 Transcript_11391/m.28805 type:complete len:177 (+) Transcript_11391:119-649(+)|eukprot:CAMPEP_0116092592 /NCGR_PEP_ID=MMETSP0327-20121206/8128_1 /TAXON_ID=44447 /ORGANISM="Pseudo-nitzschia delicatissima, Strain B596" /LENGTH=176 /DNA_ID=CAMNT_0003584035 /DNA_START=939 /DNA_END=1469 /DNA_ORIENTATION=+
MTSYNPISWVMNTVSSPEAKKRKLDDAVSTAGGVTLESIMGEINALKKSNQRIESMLKTLVGESGTKDDDEDEEKVEKSAIGDETEGEEEDEDPESVLNEAWLGKYEGLKKFKEKHGHCQVSKGGGYPDLGRWVVRQRSENKTGNMRFQEIKVAKLDALGFDWSPQVNTPVKKARK